MNRFINRLAFSLLIAIPVAVITFHNAGAQISINPPSSAFEPIRLEDQSRLWIEGVTNINTYQCTADTIAGFGRLDETERPSDTVEGHGSVTIDVKIPVYELDCGKKAMNKDMYEALKAGSYPQIHYQLKEAEFIENVFEDGAEWMRIMSRDMYEALKAGSYPQIHYQLKEAEFIENVFEDGAEWMRIMSRGIINVAGVEKEVNIPVLGKVLDNNRFHVKGEKELMMTEFDIQPPTALLGLIKAKNNITIKFDVIVTLDEMNF